jgi:hypothetical protein
MSTTRGAQNHRYVSRMEGAWASLGIHAFILRLDRGNPQCLQIVAFTLSPVSKFALRLLNHLLAPEILALHLTYDRPSNAVLDLLRFGVAKRHQKTSLVGLSGIPDVHPAPFRQAAGLEVVVQVSVPRH